MDLDDDALPGLLRGRERLGVERFHVGRARGGSDEGERTRSKDQVSTMHPASFPAFRPQITCLATIASGTPKVVTKV
jgi:hypothetical protein